MGIVNVTPDSFSDGGQHCDLDDAVLYALKLLEEGATILDIGGESTRPGATPLPAAEEIARVVPVIEALAEPVHAAGATISIDTRNGATMAAALKAGADAVNDISALTHDPHAARIVAEAGCRVILMHMKGTPQTMQLNPVYRDVVAEVHGWLQRRIDFALVAGILLERIVVDPGIGFGKTAEHNLALLQAIPHLRTLAPVMIGLSRKQFIARLSRGEPADRRLGGSIAGALHAADAGADIVRVHDVADTVQALALWRMLQN